MRSEKKKMAAGSLVLSIIHMTFTEGQRAQTHKQATQAARKWITASFEHTTNERFFEAQLM